MVGMLQILTWLVAIHLVVKGVQVLQTGLASSRDNRKVLIGIGGTTLAVCLAAAVLLVAAQEEQASSVGRYSSSPMLPSPY